VRTHPLVELVVPDPVFRLDSAQQGGGVNVPPGIARIEAAPATKNATANIDGLDDRVNVTVAVIDSGVDLNHPDLNVARLPDGSIDGVD
jgi:subtilisin family serine protease